MMLLRRAAGASLALLLFAGAAPAQEDARVLPRGYVALKVGGEFIHFDSRLGNDGGESLGAPFATPFPASRFPPLVSVRDSLTRFFSATSKVGGNFALTQDDLFPGTLDVDLAADLRNVPISLEVGVLSRLTLRVTAPIVRRETELISFGLVGGAIGFNQNADSLSKLFARVDSSLAPIGRLEFLPLANSRAGQEMQRRFTQATGDATRLPLPTFGLVGGQLDDLLVESGFPTLPIGSAPGSYLLGDVELAAKLQLLGGTGGALSPRVTGTRVAVEGVVRLPTAMDVDVPVGLTQLVVDEGHAGAGGAVFADVALSPRLWVAAHARYAFLLPRDVERFTWNPEAPWEGVDEQRTFRREPGSRIEAAAAPMFQVTPQLALSARYGFAAAGATTYEPALATDSEPVALAGLESTSAQTVQTLGVGMGYSTRSAFVERQTNIPLEVWLTYDHAFTGSGGAPDFGMVTISGRIFIPTWGGR